MQLTFDADVEAFRAEFVAFLDEHLPPEAEALDRSRSSSDVPEWARRWQRLMFDNGWLVPGNPPEFGGRNATILQQYVYQLELSRRRIYQTFNPQGVGIIAASLISFGTARAAAAVGGADPAGRDDRVARDERTGRRIRPGVAAHAGGADGDHFVVNGQKVWTSGAHDADVLLTFVRTDPDAPKHKGISALMIPTDMPGVVRRPFASACDQDDLDFNEVFFNDVRVPAENLVGPLNEGWRVANGSLGHERNMLWLSYADRLQELVEDFQSADRAGPRPVRHAGDGQPGAAAARLDRAGARRARRGGRRRAVGAEAVRLGGLADGVASTRWRPRAPTGLRIRPSSGPYSAASPRPATGPAGSSATSGRFGGTIAGGTSEIQRNIIAQRLLGLPRN